MLGLSAQLSSGAFWYTAKSFSHSLSVSPSRGDIGTDAALTQSSVQQTNTHPCSVRAERRVKLQLCSGVCALVIMGVSYWLVSHLHSFSLSHHLSKSGDWRVIISLSMHSAISHIYSQRVTESAKTKRIRGAPRGTDVWKYTRTCSHRSFRQPNTASNEIFPWTAHLDAWCEWWSNWRSGIK